MNTGSDVQGVSNFDHAEYARRWLSDSDFIFDFEVVVAEKNQLMLDYDSTTIPQQFEVALDILKQALAAEGVDDKRVTYDVSESKSGNVHVIINLPIPMHATKRVAWQAAFGSDPKREALHLLSIARREKNPILLYNRKKPQLMLTEGGNTLEHVQ